LGQNQISTTSFTKKCTLMLSRPWQPGKLSLRSITTSARELLKVGTLMREIKKAPGNGLSSFSLLRLSKPGADRGGEQAFRNRLLLQTNHFNDH
jgi:hypothetical protein